MKNTVEGGAKRSRWSPGEDGIGESNIEEKCFNENLSRAEEITTAIESVVEVLHEQILALRSPEKREEYDFALAGLKKSALAMEGLEERLSVLSAQLNAADLIRREGHQ